MNCNAGNMRRYEALAQAVGSVEAEGITADPEARAIMDQWVEGDIDSTQMRDQVGDLYFSVDRNPENLKLTEEDVKILERTPELLKTLIPTVEIEPTP